jgi:hypothetical protein
MMIIEAIESVASEHAVYFLATAYIESLHHFHRSLGLPEGVVALPLAGEADLRRRLAALANDSNAPVQAKAARAETRLVFTTALSRLQALEVPAPALAA